MDDKAATAAFSALAQPTRLEVFRLLAAELPGGLGQGAIAQRIGTPKSTMSVHLSVLVAAGLVEAERRGRDVTYRARPETASAAVDHVVGGASVGTPAD